MELKNLKLKEKASIISPYLIILAFCVLIMLPFATAYGLRGHDILYHFQAINALDVAYNNGSFFSRIYELTCQDYGYATGFFYSMIPSSTIVLIKNWLSVSALTATTIFLIMILFLSGVVVYHFIFKITKSRKKSLLSSLVYIIFPYVLSNIYIRFALTEIILTLFIPMIFLSLYYLVEEKNYVKFSVFFIISYSFSIMIHMALTIYVTFFAFIYLMLNYKKVFNKKTLIIFAICSGIVLLCSASFYLPMLTSQKDINLDDMGHDGKYLWGSTLNAFYGDAADYVVNIFLKLSIIVILTVFVLFVIFFVVYRKHNTAKQKQLLIISVILIFSILPINVFWFIIGKTKLNLIQFAWRLYLICAFACVFEFLYILSKIKPKVIRYSLVGLYFIFCLIAYIINAISPLNNIDKYFNDDFNMLSVNNGLGSSKVGDYLPKNAKYDYIVNRADDMILDSNSNVIEFANYQSIKQIQFIVNLGEVEDLEEGQEIETKYVVINIPYIYCDKIEIYQCQVDHPFKRIKLESMSQNINGEDYLKLEFKNFNGESKITIDYKEGASLFNYLIKNPFEFIIMGGDYNASFTNFIKENSHTYSVEITAERNTKIELPTLYYSGYKLTYKTNSKEYKLDAERNENGFLEVEVFESGTLYVEFKPVRVIISNIISVIGVISFIVFTVFLYEYEKKLKKQKDDSENTQSKDNTIEDVKDDENDNKTEEVERIEILE